MRVPQPDIIEHFGNADAVPQPPERCLSRQAGIVRYYLNIRFIIDSSPRTDVRTKSSVRGLLLYDFIMASGYFWHYRIILSADTASEVRQMLSQKRR